MRINKNYKKRKKRINKRDATGKIRKDERKIDFTYKIFTRP